MTLIQWQPSFNLNIDLIDQQHKMLVQLINELYESFNTKKDKQILANLINKLGVYATMHFAREEHYFEVFGYPDTDAHLEKHDYFEDMISQFEEDFNSGKQDLTVKLLNFLSDWLVDHINGSDKEYTPFLKARGVV